MTKRISDLPAKTPALTDMVEIETAGNISGRYTIQSLGSAIGAAGGGIGVDADAIHDNVGGEISAITEKTIVAAADVVVIEDSAASYAKKKVQLSALSGMPLTVLDVVAVLGSGDNDDYAPTGYTANTDILLVAGHADGTSAIAGLTGGAAGRILTIVNNTTNNVHLTHQGAGSAAANQFEFNTLDGITLGYAEGATFFYESTLQKWVCIDERKERNSLRLPGVSAQAITESKNNWNLTVFLTKTFILLDPDAAWDVTGLSGGAATTDGSVLVFVNVDAAYTITFKNNSGSSSAGNKFQMAADYALAPGRSVIFWYDTTNTCWRLLAGSASTDANLILTDVTTNNASTSAHGFAPKATAPAAGLLSVLGIGNGETVRTDKAIFDTTNPEAIGVAAPGTQVVAARRDHVHAISIPHMMQSDTTDQAIANAAAAQVITFDTDEHHLGITRTSSSRFTCPTAGSYSVTFTGTAVGVNTKVIQVWPRVSGSDVANSNTAYTFKSSGGVAVITAHFILHLTANQYIEMWTWGDDTGNRWDATAVGSSPDRPAIPSVRLTIEYLAAD